jgi:tetratricopeptide (TPR) repeat protein
MDESLRESAWGLFVSGELELAEQRALEESRANPANVDLLLTLAEIALARRDDQAAITRAGRVLELRRDDYDALLITAVAHARQGSAIRATAALKRALRYDDTERRLTVFQAVLEATGELDDRPVDARPHCLLAHLHRYLRIYDPAQARPAFGYAERAIKAGDQVDDAYVTLGVLHTKHGQPRRGFEAFQHAVAVNPRNTAALLGAVRFHETRGELEEADRLLRTALEVDRRDAFVVPVFHAFLIARLGDYRRGLSFGEAVVAENPNDGDAWSRLAHVQRALGDHPTALRSYQRAATLMDSAEVHESIGDMLADLGRDQDAFAAYSRAVAIDPRRPGPHHGLAILHGKARRWTEAKREFEAMLGLGGGFPVSLCEVYAELGERTKAQLCATMVLTTNPEDFQSRALIEHLRGAREAAGTR